jgi:hypothetical protein
MPKRMIDLTAKQQILIALTCKKLSESPSEIQKVLGFKSQQIYRELYDVNGLINEGLVEKDGKGFLRLTDKGKREPLVSMFLLTKRIGKILIIGNFVSLLILLYGLVSSSIEYFHYDLLLTVIIILMSLMQIIGWYMYLYPRILLREIHHK